MVASYHGHRLDMPAMRKRFLANLKGMNLQQLIELGDGLGLASRALQCPLEEVHKLQTPCILHWDMNHFVVLTKVSGKGAAAKFAINDPAVGKRRVAKTDCVVSGIAIICFDGSLLYAVGGG